MQVGMCTVWFCLNWGRVLFEFTLHSLLSLVIYFHTCSSGLIQFCLKGLPKFLLIK